MTREGVLDLVSDYSITVLITLMKKALLRYYTVPIMHGTDLTASPRERP